MTTTEADWDESELKRICSAWPDGPHAPDESEEIVLRRLESRANANGVVTTTDRALGRLVGHGRRDVLRIALRGWPEPTRADA